MDSTPAGSSASSASLTAELEAISSKRASLKDRMKRRREAMGNILNEASRKETGGTTAAVESKKKEEEDKVGHVSCRSSHHVQYVHKTL